MTALKTIIFILLVPGFLLGVVPVLVIPQIFGPTFPSGFWLWLAIPFWLIKIAFIVWCGMDFVREGHGTPIPLEPPKRLVVSGLYQYVRNPMYVGVLLIQAGTIFWFGTLVQLIYWFFLFIGFTLFIRANEEPHLRKTFGVAYEVYCQSVPRWIPRRK